MSLGTHKDFLDAFLVIGNNLLFELFDSLQFCLVLLLQGGGTHLLQLPKLALKPGLFFLQLLLRHVYLAVELSVNLLLSHLALLGCELPISLRGDSGRGLHDDWLWGSLHHHSHLLGDRGARNECNSTDEDYQSH